MHIWPSLKIRDSFKVSYLFNLERNLHRMNTEKKKQSALKQTLLDDEATVSSSSTSPSSSWLVTFWRDLRVALSLYCCCFIVETCIDP